MEDRTAAELAQAAAHIAGLAEHSITPAHTVQLARIVAEIARRADED